MKCEMVRVEYHRIPVKMLIPSGRQIEVMAPRMCPADQGIHPGTDEPDGTSVVPTLGRNLMFRFALQGHRCSQ